MSLEAEGFEETATVDRLLLEMDRYGAGKVLGEQAVLVVDEAGLVGSRKLVGRPWRSAWAAGSGLVHRGGGRQQGSRRALRFGRPACVD
jgi:hypothetical protein